MLEAVRAATSTCALTLGRAELLYRMLRTTFYDDYDDYDETYICVRVSNVASSTSSFKVASTYASNANRIGLAEKLLGRLR